MSAMPTPEEAMRFMRAAVVDQQIDLSGPWEGWRIRGRDLVAPHGQRIPARRLEGLLWREEMELRRAGFASRKKAESERRNSQLVKVVVVPLSDYLEGRKIAAA
jgi:hypothetical protein